MSAANEAIAEKLALTIALAMTPDGCTPIGWEIMDCGSAVGVAWECPDGWRNAAIVRLRLP